MSVPGKWLSPLNRAVLHFAPIAGVLLIGGYLVTGINLKTPHAASIEELPLPDSWQMPGEEITDQVRAAVIASGGTVVTEAPTTALAPDRTASIDPSATPAVAPLMPPKAQRAQVRKKPDAKTEAKPETLAQKPLAAPPPGAPIPPGPPQRADAKRDPAKPPVRTASVSPQKQPKIIEPPSLKQLPPPPPEVAEAPVARPVARAPERGVIGRSWDAVSRTTVAVTDAAVAAPATVWRATRKTVDVVVDTTVDTAKAIIPRRGEN